MKIGVFDSGVGGLSVANSIKMAFQEAEVILKEDKKNLQYGTKTVDQIHKLVLPILQSLVDEGCQVVVVACNTVTTNLIDRLREEIKVPLVGMEPMVKPAAELTRTGVIAICATPTTLASKRYKWLKQEYAKGVEVLEPDCSDWAKLIENNQLNSAKISELVEDVCRARADVIVLGCTHYHWVEEDILQAAQGRAEILQPEEQIIKQLKSVLGQQI